MGLAWDVIAPETLIEAIELRVAPHRYHGPS